MKPAPSEGSTEGEAARRSIELFDQGRSMNDIAESLLDAGYFATHTRALVFASRAIGDRPIPRAVSNFSGLNFLVGLMLVLAGVVTTVAYGFLFIAWDQNVLTYFGDCALDTGSRFI